MSLVGRFRSSVVAEITGVRMRNAVLIAARRKNWRPRHGDPKWSPHHFLCLDGDLWRDRQSEGLGGFETENQALVRSGRAISHGASYVSVGSATLARVTRLQQVTAPAPLPHALRRGVTPGCVAQPCRPQNTTSAGEGPTLAVPCYVQRRYPRRRRRHARPPSIVRPEAQTTSVAGSGTAVGGGDVPT